MSLWDDLNDDSISNGRLRLQSFLGLYIFALIYELALSYDALRRRNTIQLVGLCICNQGLFAYGILQMTEIKDTISSLADEALGERLRKLYQVELILVPVFLGIGTMCMAFFTWKLRAEFSWSIYKNISADLQMKRRYFTYQVCCDAADVLCFVTDRFLLGLYHSPEIRFLLRIRKSTPNPPCCVSSSKHGFYHQCLFDPSHDSDPGPVGSILQAREDQIAYTDDGKDSRLRGNIQATNQSSSSL